MDSRTTIKRYLDDLRVEISQLPLDQIEAIVNVLQKAREDGKRVFIMGNGGSAATASHFASDLNKGANTPGQRRFKAMAFTDNVPVMTAWANDSSYTEIFSEQVENHVEPGDIVIGISGSGKSPNVVNALKLAKQKGAYTIALTGMGGGLVKDIAALCLVVPSDCMERIEDIHLAVEHAITSCLRNRGKA
jgi:D-sedoheptulose 7-phosphate isomerase